jgi:glycosyltransferase involved in cell wall biosynthesis
MIDVKRQLHRKFISKILSMFEQTLCKSISLLVVTSENFYEQFYKKTVTLDKVIFMPNTPDPEVFSGFQRNHNDRFTVGFIGAVRYAEQLEMLIDVSVEANIDVLIAGGGKDYLRIKKYAETYENVKVYGEYKYDDEIKGLYEQVDCIYSVYDTKLTNVQIALPNRLYEAAYTATPLIASKNTYLAELVEKYEIGRTIAADSKSELIETILYLKHNPGYFKSIDENAEIFKNDWSFNKYNENLLEKIGNIV